MPKSVVKITRPNDTTAYTAGDCLGDVNNSPANSAILVFPNVGATSKHIIITDVNLEVDVTSVPSGMSTFTFSVYASAPATAYADNEAWDLPAADRPAFETAISLTTPIDMGSTLLSLNPAVNTSVVLSGVHLYAIIKTDGAYTPSASAVKKISLYYVPVIEA